MGADAGVASVMKADGPQHEGAFAHRFHQFFQNLLPGLCVLLIEIAEFLAEPVGLQFPGHQFVHLGGKKLSFKDSLFFRHGAFLLSLFPFASISENPPAEKEPSEKRFRKLPQDPVFYEIMAHTAVMSSLLSPARRAAALISASARAWGGASFWESITCSISSSVSTSDTPSEVM